MSTGTESVYWVRIFYFFNGWVEYCCRDTSVVGPIICSLNSYQDFYFGKETN